MTDGLLTADNLTALGLLLLIVGIIAFALIRGKLRTEREVETLTKMWEERIAIAESRADKAETALEIALDTNRLLTGVKAEATYQHTRTIAQALEAAQNLATGGGDGHEHPAS